MTKEHYLDMCEMLKQEPIPENTPIEYEDLHEDVQEAIVVYNALQDNWDTMNGIYLGKVMTGIIDIFKMRGVDDHTTCFDIIRMIDNARSQILNKKSTKPA
jgi:hypothetical protein